MHTEKLTTRTLVLTWSRAIQLSDTGNELANSEMISNTISDLHYQERISGHIVTY